TALGAGGGIPYRDAIRYGHKLGLWVAVVRREKPPAIRAEYDVRKHNWRGRDLAAGFKVPKFHGGWLPLTAGRQRHEAPTVGAEEIPNVYHRAGLASYRQVVQADDPQLVAADLQIIIFQQGHETPIGTDGHLGLQQHASGFE